MSILDFLGNLPLVQALQNTSISSAPQRDENPLMRELMQNIAKGDPYPHVSPEPEPAPTTEGGILGNIPFYPDQMPKEDPIKEALSQAVAKRQNELEAVPLSKIQQMALERVRPPKMTGANAEPVDPTRIIDDEYKQWLLSQTPEAKKTATAVEEVKSQLGEKSTPTAIVKPVSTEKAIPGTTTTSLPERKEEVPGFPAMPEIKRTSISGELEKLAEGLPKSIEELVGERPTGQRRSILGNIVAGAGMGLAGYDPYQMEQNAQAQREAIYLQKLNFAKERAGKVHELKLKALDAKVKEEDRVQEEQDQALAKMGEMNPELAKNPNYINRLFRGLPQEVRDKLIAESVDPVTGTFKKGSALYYDPMRRERLKITAGANLLTEMGVDATTEQKILFAYSPEKFFDLITNKEKEIKNRIISLANDQTPGARKESDRLMEVLGKINNWKPNLTEVQEYNQKLEVWKQEKASVKKHIAEKYAGHPDIIKQENESGKEKTPLSVTQDPLYAAAVAINPGIEVGYGKTNAPGMWNEFSALESAASSVPKGQDIYTTLVNGKSMYSEPYRMAVGKWSQRITGLGFGDAMNEAATAWKGLNRIPFYNIAAAASMAINGEKNKLAIRNMLIAGIGTK
jgi:hypothetical protein